MKHRPLVGIILAAGRGARMKNAALPFSKTLLPVSGTPVIAYAARALAPFVEKILLVTNPLTSDAVLSVVTKNLPVGGENVEAVMQPAPLGVAHAIKVAVDALPADSTIVVVCGDNIIVDNQNILAILESVRSGNETGAEINLAWTYREFSAAAAKRFAVWDPAASAHGALVEKPEKPPSRICWCGPIAFRSSDDVKNRISRLKPSARGEYEAAELMNSYITNGEARRFLLSGLWFDVGSEQALKDADSTMEQQNNRKID